MMQIAQDRTPAITGAGQLLIIATARPDQALDKLQAVIDEELTSAPRRRAAKRRASTNRSQLLPQHGASAGSAARRSS
jgi:hypothetical protein